MSRGNSDDPRRGSSTQNDFEPALVRFDWRANYFGMDLRTEQEVIIADISKRIYSEDHPGPRNRLSGLEYESVNLEDPEDHLEIYNASSDDGMLLMIFRNSIRFSRSVENPRDMRDHLEKVAFPFLRSTFTRPSESSQKPVLGSRGRITGFSYRFIERIDCQARLKLNGIQVLGETVGRLLHPELVGLKGLKVKARQGSIGTHTILMLRILDNIGVELMIRLNVPAREKHRYLEAQFEIRSPEGELPDPEHAFLWDDVYSKFYIPELQQGFLALLAARAE